MSETLSYQPEVQTESAPDNLTPEEQDSLAVGEKLQENKKVYWLVNIKVQKN